MENQEIKIRIDELNKIKEFYIFSDNPKGVRDYVYKRLKELRKELKRCKN